MNARTLRYWLQRRLAWRLCLLFVAGALLPVALSDWLVITVIEGVADKLDADQRTQAVRAASRQVLDRIKLGEMLLQSLADTGNDPGATVAPAFDRLWCPQRGEAGATAKGDAALVDTWRRVAGGTPSAHHARLALTPGGPVNVLVGTTTVDGRLCVAALGNEFLWEPLRNGADDAVWAVQDPDGRTLAQGRGADADSDSDAARARASDWRPYTARLFMGGDGVNQEWTFVQKAPHAHVDWQRQPVAAWLAAVAGATLLIVGLVGQSRIRRALAPLERLTAGTRRLARGESTTRVDVHGGDEIGELALAFNDMAAKLEERAAQLQFRAVHDDLTGLTNRFGLHQILDSLLRGDGGSGELAVLFIDLDFFKDVNDRHGHAVGDQVLCLTAQRLGRIDDGLIVARKGGDEFVVIVQDGAAEARARTVAARVLAALAEPFVLADSTHVCGASIGISLCPTHATTAEELLRCADIALYESKRTGRGRFTVFDPALDDKIRCRHDMLSALRIGLDRKELVVHFQPRLNVESGLIESAEALVRWERPGHGLVLPNEFIELAETSGLIGALGTEVLDQALSQMARWQNSGLRLKRISVNVSPRQFEAGDLPEQVHAALLRHAVEPSRLELEVTESLLSGDVSEVKRQLASVRSTGVTVAMDDFGTGYSSMALLRSLPIDVMKIDRAFVCDLEIDPNAQAIARTIVTLGRSLSLRLVAEGIETHGQAELLRQMGCDEFQGYLFGMPMPAQAFETLLGLRPAERAQD
jgi:diguanylate cyclase (GGDEF)-like protein